MHAQTLIVDLGRSLDEPQDSANLQIAVLSFFNAVINYKAGQVRVCEGAVKVSISAHSASAVQLQLSPRGISECFCNALTRLAGSQ